MNITVYLGANEGNDPGLRKAVEELGTWIGSSGNALVYGGSRSGLMGAIADSVLLSGGEVTGGVHGASRLGTVAVIDALTFGMIAGENFAAMK